MGNRLNETFVFAGKDRPVPLDSPEGLQMIKRFAQERRVKSITPESGSLPDLLKFGKEMIGQIEFRRAQIKSRLSVLDKKLDNPNEIRIPADDRIGFLANRKIEIEREGQALLEELGSLHSKQAAMEEGFTHLAAREPVTEEFRALMQQEESKSAEAIRRAGGLPLPEDVARLKATADILQIIGR